MWIWWYHQNDAKDVRDALDSYIRFKPFKGSNYILCILKISVQDLGC